MHFGPPMGTTKPPEMGSVGHREVCLPAQPGGGGTVVHDAVVLGSILTIYRVNHVVH